MNSVSNWSTDEDDVDRSVDAILRCASASLGREDRWLRVVATNLGSARR